MDDTAKRKGGGAKMTRSETVTVRLEPKLRYLAELAGRKQRRTLSSFIEWAIQRTLDDIAIDSGSAHNDRTTVSDAANELWDVDEEDRFVKLALRFPDLLTHDEQVLWKLVRECGLLWRGKYSGPDREWTWVEKEESFIFTRLREYWPTFLAVAAGEKARNELPKWKEVDDSPRKKGFEEMDDDIPF